MNKIKVLTGIVLSMVFIISGCGIQSDTSGMVEYKSLSGNVSIPKNPKRIVTDYYVGQLLSLDANLVGADLTYTSPAWKDKLNNVENIGQSTEKIAATNPDLIITFNEKGYESYKAIAPTVLIPYGSYNEEDIILELGKIINKEDKAKNVIKDMNNDIDELSSLVKNKDETWSILEVITDPYIYGNKYARLGYVIYDKMHLKGTKKAEDTILKSDNSFVQLTEELIGDYVGDNVILSTPNAKPVDNNLLKSNTFKNTSAYKNKNIFYVPAELFYHSDPISMKEQMKEFKEILKNEK